MHYIFRDLFKYTLFFFNLSFVGIGIAIIVLESLSLTENDDLLIPFKTFVPTIPILIFSCGILTAVISAFGCYGSIVNSDMAMMIFDLTLFFFIVVDCCLSLIFAIFTNYCIGIFHAFLKQSFYTRGGNDEIMWEFIQSQLECCRYSDSNSDWPTLNDGILPASCCRKDEDECTIKNAFTSHCEFKIDKWTNNNAVYLFFAVGGVQMLKVLAILLSSWYVYERSFVTVGYDNFEDDENNDEPAQFNNLDVH